jgi:hypothetical protein
MAKQLHITQTNSPAAWSPSLARTLRSVVGRAEQGDDGTVGQRGELVQVAAGTREEHDGVVRGAEGAVRDQPRRLGAVKVGGVGWILPVVGHVVQLAVQHPAGRGGAGQQGARLGRSVCRAKPGWRGHGSSQPWRTLLAWQPGAPPCSAVRPVVQS